MILQRLNHNPLYLIEPDHVGGSVVFVVRGLSCAAIAWAFSSVPPASRYCGDPGRSKGVTADFYRHPRVGNASADHAPHVDTMHREAREDAGLADRRPQTWSQLPRHLTGSIDDRQRGRW
jgi:hypothetical protein